MDIATTRVEPHEIAKNEDFEFGFQSLIRNMALLDRMLMSSDIDYIAGGFVRAIAGTMTCSVEAIWANGKGSDLPAFQDTESEPVNLIAPAVYPRIDIVQVRGHFEAYDKQRRAFYEPELGAALYKSIDTKNRLIIEIQIKQGDEGANHAPETDTGYVKIAEIHLEPETAVISQEDIKNVTAKFQGDENTEWTTEKNRTFLVGKISEIWDAFRAEHLVDGGHRESVIKASNILRGIAEDALKGSVVSIGENINSGELSLPATKNIAEALAVIGHTLHGDVANTLLKKLAMLMSWKDTETYQPFTPAFFQGRIYYANPLNLPGAGESPGSAPKKWLNAAGDVAYLPRQDGVLYGMKNRVWTEIDPAGIGEAIKALKFYSKKTIMFTNARIVDRRLRGWDLGLAYLSADHEVYHFDTDNNNQNQESNIIINYDGDAPVRRGRDDFTEELSFEPAVSDNVPFEMMGKSLFGAFSVAGLLAPQNSTLEFWMRIFVEENSMLLRLGALLQDRVTLHIGGADPAYSSAAEGDIPYSHPDDIDGLPYSAAKTSGNTLNHNWGAGNESIDLDTEGVELDQAAWLHIAFVLTSDRIKFFINGRQFSFERKRPAADPLPFVINEELDLFNLDELSIITGAALSFETFSENSETRIPYAALDYTQKYAVIMVDDPQKLRTNLFESGQFREAVQAIIDGA